MKRFLSLAALVVLVGCATYTPEQRIAAMVQAWEVNLAKADRGEQTFEQAATNYRTEVYRVSSDPLDRLYAEQVLAIAIRLDAGFITKEQAAELVLARNQEVGAMKAVAMQERAAQAPAQAERNRAMMDLGLGLLLLSRPAPPPANCISSVVGGFLHTRCN